MNKLQLSFQEFSLTVRALSIQEALNGYDTSETIKALSDGYHYHSGSIELTASQYGEVMCALKYYVNPGQDMIVSDEAIDIASGILTRNGVKHITKGGERYKEILEIQRSIAKLKVNQRFQDFVDNQYDGRWSRLLRKIRNGDELTKTEEEIANEYKQLK